MAIEPEDFALFKEARQVSPEPGACAILGDCNIHVGLERFKQELNFNIVDTFDINGKPTYKVDLNEPHAIQNMNAYFCNVLPKFLKDVPISHFLIPENL